MNDESAGARPDPVAAAPPDVGPARSFWLWLAGLLAFGLVLRLLQLEEFLRVNPIAERPWTDAWTYWQMAARMAEGQWLDDRPFVYAPLYPYALGMIRSVGGGLLTVYVLQLVLHLATAGMIGVATRLRFGNLAGLFGAGLFLALTEPAVSSTRLLGNTPQLFLLALLWWRWVVCEQRGRRWRDVPLVGGLIGLCALSYPAAMLLVPAYGLWLLLHPGGFAGRLARAAVGILCAVLLISPATLHNRTVSGELIPICTHAGINLLVGNGPSSSGIIGTIPGVRPNREVFFDDAAKVYEQRNGRPGTWKEIDGYYRSEAIRYCLDHPLSALQTIGQKLRYFTCSRHYDDMMPITFERELGVNRTSYLSPIATPWLIGFALVGLAAVLRRPVRNAPEWLLALLPLATVLIFFYTARYRLPVVPLLCGLSGYALAHCWRFRAPRYLTIAGFLLPVPLLLSNVLTGFDSPDEARGFFVRAFSEGHVLVGRERVKEERLEEAEESFRRAIEVSNGNHLAHLHLGTLLAKQGRVDEAIPELSTAVQLRRDDLPGYGYLYNAQCTTKRYEDAARTLRAAAHLSSRNPHIRLALAWLLATCPDEEVRDGAEALSNVRIAQASLPPGASSFDMLDVLAAAHAEAGELEAAVEAARQALQIARQQGRQKEAAAIQRRLQGYRDGQPSRARPRVLLPSMLR